MPYSKQWQTLQHTRYCTQVLDEVPDLEDDDDEELPDADADLRDMAARHEAFRASEQAARANMEGGWGRECQGGTDVC